MEAAGDGGMRQMDSVRGRACEIEIAADRPVRRTVMEESKPSYRLRRRRWQANGEGAENGK